MSLREAQERVDRWIGQYQEGYFSQKIDLERAFDQMMAKVTSRDADRWTRKGG